MLIINTCRQVKSRSIIVCLRESRVRRILQIQFRALKLLAQQTRLHTNTQRTTQQGLPICILCNQSLMLEQTYLVIHNLQTHAMHLIKHYKRHITRDIHCTRVMLKACQRHGISTYNVDFHLLACSSRIKRRLHRPVVTERWFLLCPDYYQKEPQQQK